MNRQQASKIIREIAKNNGVDENEVRREMNQAIIHGFLNPATHNRWIDIFGENNLPDPEEFIITMSTQKCFHLKKYH